MRTVGLRLDDLDEDQVADEIADTVKLASYAFNGFGARDDELDNLCDVILKSLKFEPRTAKSFEPFDI